jgi:hypothetical protein
VLNEEAARRMNEGDAAIAGSRRGARRRDAMGTIADVCKVECKVEWKVECKVGFLRDVSLPRPASPTLCGPWLRPSWHGWADGAWETPDLGGLIGGMIAGRVAG